MDQLINRGNYVIYIVINMHICISIIQKKGAAAARNYAMKKASGEYVLFVDADDYIDGNSLKTILKEIQKSQKDMYMLKAYKIYGGERKYALNTWKPFSINYTKAEWIKWCAQMP